MTKLAAVSSNPREVIGGNFPPEPTAIERAEPHIEALREFLNANPVISTEDEARDGKAVLDNVASALRLIEAERDGKVRPLNEQVDAVNAEYHRLHNAGNKKKPGTWDRLVAEVKRRLSDYALEEERKRFEVEEAARQAAAAAVEEARRAAQAEEEARAAAEAGVCDVDLAEAVEAADTTSQIALRAMWTARRTEQQTRVRITGGSGRAISLQDHEILTVADWKAAIEDVGVTDEIADAIVKAARAYRKEYRKLPRGIEIITERGL